MLRNYQLYVQLQQQLTLQIKLRKNSNFRTYLTDHQSFISLIN